MILSGFETNSSAKQVITTWTGIHSIRTIKTAFFTHANLKLEDYMEISIPLETPIANAVDAGDNSGHGGFGDGHGGFCSQSCPGSCPCSQCVAAPPTVPTETVLHPLLLLWLLLLLMSLLLSLSLPAFLSLPLYQLHPLFLHLTVFWLLPVAPSDLVAPSVPLAPSVLAPSVLVAPSVLQ